MLTDSLRPVRNLECSDNEEPNSISDWLGENPHNNEKSSGDRVTPVHGSPGREDNTRSK